MCLLLIGYKVNVNYPIIIAANRDEFYARETKNLYFWEQEGIFAGKDIQAGGTWLAFHRDGRFAAITNIKKKKKMDPNKLSRGLIITDFLKDTMDASHFVETLSNYCLDYQGFNLLVGSEQGLFFLNSEEAVVQRLPAGVYGISNASLDTPWPKLMLAKSLFEHEITSESPSSQQMFELLKNEQHFPDYLLPETGVGAELEKLLSTVFIKSNAYGTRSSAVILQHASGSVVFEERDHLSGQQHILEFEILK